MPIDEKRLESVRFYDPNQERGRRIKFDFVKMWRGDHSRCPAGHHSKECVAARGWIMHGATLRLAPHVVPVNISERSMGTVEYPGVKGKYPESTHQAKGMRDAAESDGVRPTQEVVHYHIERAARALKSTMEQRGAKFFEVEAALAEYRSKIESANSTGASVEEKPERAKRHG